MPFVRKAGTATPAGKSANPAATTGFIEDLSSASEETRWAAARAAAGNADCAAALAAALRIETAARVREALFTGLARMGAAGVSGILPLLRSDEAHLRTGALDALRSMIRSTGELLPPLLNDGDVDVRVLSCELARSLPGDAASELLCALLQRELEPNVCAAAVDVLAEVGQADALPVLADCALKFRDTPFLAFAIQVTADRIRSQTTRVRG